MDRGAWRAASPWACRVGHDLATDPPPPEVLNLLVAASGPPVLEKFCFSVSFQLFDLAHQKVAFGY